MQVLAIPLRRRRRRRWHRRTWLAPRCCPPPSCVRRWPASWTACVRTRWDGLKAAGLLLRPCAAACCGASLMLPPSVQRNPCLLACRWLPTTLPRALALLRVCRQQLQSWRRCLWPLVQQVGAEGEEDRSRGTVGMRCHSWRGHGAPQEEQEHDSSACCPSGAEPSHQSYLPRSAPCPAGTQRRGGGHDGLQALQTALTNVHDLLIHTAAKLQVTRWGVPAGLGGGAGAVY